MEKGGFLIMPTQLCYVGCIQGTNKGITTQLSKTPQRRAAEIPEGRI